MKRNTLLLALAGLLSAACNSLPAEKADIEQVAFWYGYTTANYDLDAAALYCTPETQSSALNFGKTMMRMVDSAYIISDTPAHIDITSVRQTSDSSAYAVYHKSTPTKNFSDTLHLRLRDGRWLVHAPLPVGPKRNHPHPPLPTADTLQK